MSETRIFCEKHNRFYQGGTGCFDCIMEGIDDEILSKQLIIHEFVPAANACKCYWVAEFGGNLSAYEKWVKHFVKSFRPSRDSAIEASP